MEFDSGDFRKDIIKETKANIEKTIKSTVCNEHGERPKVNWKKSKSSENFNFELVCCCENLKEKTLAKLED